MATLLIAEDDPTTNEAVCAYLSELGHETIAARDGCEALSLFLRHAPDLVILDIMMPQRSGLSVLHEIRSTSAVPVLLLTALEDEYTQVRGFDELADDYLTKPFSLVLLGRRVGALLRRCAPTAAPGGDAVVIGDVTVDFAAYTARDKDGPIEVTPKELDLLRLLVECRGLVLTRTQIVDALWGGGHPIGERIVDTYVKNLRRKLRLDAIATVRGIGYRLDAGEDGRGRAA